MRKPTLLQRIRRFYGIDEPDRDGWADSAEYRRRLRWVQFGWVVAGLVILALGHNAAAIGIGLFMTFLSFAVLEKS
ncbi:MAG: hypothetical protein K6L60_02505 [Oceanobacter sp.]